MMTIRKKSRILRPIFPPARLPFPYTKYHHERPRTDAGFLRDGAHGSLFPVHVQCSLSDEWPSNVGMSCKRCQPGSAIKNGTRVIGHQGVCPTLSMAVRSLPFSVAGTNFILSFAARTIRFYLRFPFGCDR